MHQFLACDNFNTAMVNRLAPRAFLLGLNKQWLSDIIYLCLKLKSYG